MEGNEPIAGGAGGRSGMNGGRTRYGRLFRRFVLLTMVCSLVPLLLVGWGINIHYTRFANSGMISSFERQVEHHRKVIELFLKECSSELRILAGSHPRDSLAHPEALRRTFELINDDGASFTDLGVISAEGRHLAYVGPYDLMDKVYSEAFWFKEVMERGLYISDMFLGFRNEPHFVIAVTSMTGGEKWILRATVNSEFFRSLVEDVKIGRTGEVYLLNREGIFQTKPRLGGEIMTAAPDSPGPYHEGIRVEVLESGTGGGDGSAPRRIVGRAWLEEPRWVLVVKQDHSEAFGAVNHANFATLVFLHLSAASIIIVTVLVARHMITVIRRRDAEAEQLNLQLLQAGKMASIGELSAGVAHEINNPLAIIMTERQLMLDAETAAPLPDKEFRKQFGASMDQIGVQIERCKRITQNLLRFSRRTRSVIERVDLNAFLEEVVELMEREAATEGIAFAADLEEGPLEILSDPSQLQQVFLNLITNAVDALRVQPYGTITVKTRRDAGGGGVRVVIADTGPGIAPENLERIFDPFFTTKPVGQGTGLGLAICYGTVRRLGGTITVRSEPGRGAEFTVFLPDKPPGGIPEQADPFRRQSNRFAGLEAL